MEVVLTIREPDDPGALDGLDMVPVTYNTDEPTFGVVFAADGRDLAAAVAEALDAVAEAGGEVVRVVVSNGDVPQPLVGVAEFADMKGVTKQYASTLSMRHDFPEPEAILRAAPVWDAVRVARYLRDAGRRDGRSRRRVR